MIYRTRKLWLMMLALMLAPIIGAYAQVNEITLSKPGRLKKELKKAADTITTLKVNGVINGEDIEFMISLPKLTSLDLGNAKINESYTYPAKSKISSELLGSKSGESYTSETLLISGSRFLDKLVLPIRCYAIAVLPPEASDEVYALPYYKIGNLVASERIDRVKCSKHFFVEYMVCPFWHEDYWTEIWNMKLIKQANPCIVKSKQGNYSLIEWHESFDELLKACNRYNIPEIVSALPDAFSSIKCGNVLDLRGLNLRSLCKKAFSGCKAGYLILPESIKDLSQEAFDKSLIDTIEFTSKQAPILGSSFSKDNRIYEEMAVIVPDGCLKNYLYGGWNRMHVKEKNGIMEYEFTIDKPGNLGKYLTYEISKTVEKLTLKGAIYDTDIEYINECKNLTYLDLTYCYVAKSPQTIQKEQANREFYEAVFQMLGEMAQENAQNQYEHGNISYAEAMNSVVWGEYAKQVAEQIKQDKVEASENCICPKIELRKLVEYHMPVQAKVIYAGNCPSLEKVVLPPKATAVEYYGFAGCEKLKEITFPNTLIRIGGGAFRNCRSLEILDFTKTQLVEIVRKNDGTFEGCEKLQLVAFPKTFQSFPEYSNKNPMCHWVFLSEEKPQYVRVPDGCVHIPKGCINGWRSVANDQYIRLIDDVEIKDK